MKDQVAIPIEAAKRIAEEFGYDQIVIVGRRVGGFEHVTTYGVDKANCTVAARMGNFFKHKLMGWPEEDKPYREHINPKTGQPWRISDPEIAEEIAQITRTPEQARAFLQSSGILDRNGVLAENYGGTGEWTKPRIMK